MSLIRITILTFMLLLSSRVKVAAQFLANLTENMETEAGISLGMMNTVSDIMGNRYVYQGPFAGATLRKTKFTGGLYAGAMFNNQWGLRFEANLGKVEGHDSLNKDAKAPSAIGRYVRNLNFRSPIRELSLLGVFNIREIINREQAEDQRKFTTYGLAGMHWFGFNPQAYTGNGWVDLHPLRLEGQGFAEYPTRKVYKKHSLAYSLGIGVTMNVSPSVNVRFEVLKRTAFTDYIDDVHEGDWVNPALFDNYLSPAQAALAKQLYNRSTTINPPRNTRPRGHPSENDAYWTGVVKLGWKFNRRSQTSYYYNGAGQRIDRKGALRRVRCSNL